MTNIQKDCRECIFSDNREKCFTCIENNNFQPRETSKHINRAFFDIFVVLGLAIGLIIIIKVLSIKEEIVETIKAPQDTIYNVTASVYHAVEGQCDSDPDITAMNYKIDLNHPDKHRFIAISRDLERTIIGKDTIVNFRKGDSVVVKGAWPYDGIWIVGDRMKYDKVNQIDFLIAKGQYVHKWYNITLKKK